MKYFLCYICAYGYSENSFNIMHFGLYETMAAHPEQLSIENAILVVRLPPSLIIDAEEKIYEFIRRESVICSVFEEVGLKIFFKNYNPVRKAISRGFIEVERIHYSLNLLVTPLTIHGIAPFVEEKQLRGLIRHWGEIHNMYKETKPEHEGAETLVETGNYRVNLTQPDSENYIPKNYVVIPGKNVQFAVTPHCRHCLGNGHVWYKCNEKENCYRYIKLKQHSTEEWAQSSEVRSEITLVEENCLNSLISSNENVEDAYQLKEFSSIQQTSNETTKDKTDIENRLECEFFSNNQCKKNQNTAENQCIPHLSKFVSPDLLCQKKECFDFCQRIINATLINVREKSTEFLNELEGNLPDTLPFNEKDNFLGNDPNRKILEKPILEQFLEVNNDSSSTDEYEEENESFSTFTNKLRKDSSQPKDQLLRNTNEEGSAGPSTIIGGNTTSNNRRKPSFSTNLQEETHSFKFVKTRPRVSISKRLTPGLFIANNKTERIMPPDVFLTFLSRVRRKKHPGVIARKFARSVHQTANTDLVIFKIREMLALFELGRHCSSKDIAEAGVLKNLEQRLMKHKDCETCTTKP